MIPQNTNRQLILITITLKIIIIKNRNEQPNKNGAFVTASEQTYGRLNILHLNGSHCNSQSDVRYGDMTN